MSEEQQPSRRGVLASLLMGFGLFTAYTTLTVQGFLFLLPRRRGPRTRLLFAGQISEYALGGVKTVYDLEGTPILVKRTAGGFTAYDSTCPHLGCKVLWEPEDSRFFCPCHRGVFDVDGVATAGPPADAGQNLAQVPMRVDEEAGVVYLEVKDIKRNRA